MLAPYRYRCGSRLAADCRGGGGGDVAGSAGVATGPSGAAPHHRGDRVFDSGDSPGRFTIDEPAQNQRNVALGPYYLIWDNIHHPELKAEGAIDWPYQVTEVSLPGSGREALLPGQMASRYAETAAFAQKYCLTCHKINGVGGDKWPIDLARRAKQLEPMVFERWVLVPSAVKPGTTMPPLAQHMPQAERQAWAQRLFAYLNALPQAP